MKVPCFKCGKRFEKKKPRIKKSKRHYCSRQCMLSSLPVECSQCGKKIMREQNQLKKGSKHFFCSRGCQGVFRRSKLNVACSLCGNSIKRFSGAVHSNSTGLFFCDMECKSGYYAKKNMVKCRVCGKTFCKSGAEQRRHPNHCCSIECRARSNARLIDISCFTCGKHLRRPPSLLNGKKRAFCSKECHDMFQDKKMLVNCDLCGKQVRRSPANVKKSRRHFCSVKCSGKFAFRYSEAEAQFEDLVKAAGIDYERNNRSILNGLELDFWLPECHVAVEIDGPTHHFPVYGNDVLKKQQERDRKKRRMCKDLGIQLRRVKVCSDGEKYVSRLKRVIWEIKINEALA